MELNEALEIIFQYEATIHRPFGERWVREELIKPKTDVTTLVPAFGLPKGNETIGQYCNYAEKCIDYLRFGYEVDACLSDELGRYDDIMVRKTTPELLCELGCDDLPMLETQRHLRNELHAQSSIDPSWHGLDVQLIKEIPELLESPCIVMDSLSDRGGIVCILDAVDSVQTPIIVPFVPDGYGHYHSQGVSSNFILSIYGKNGISSYIERGYDANKILFVDKYKLESLMSFAGLQLPEACMRLDGIIQQTQQRRNSRSRADLPDEAIHGAEISPAAQKQSKGKLPGPDRAAKHATPAVDAKAAGASAKAQTTATRIPTPKVVK